MKEDIFKNKRNSKRKGHWKHLKISIIEDRKISSKITPIVELKE